MSMTAYARLMQMKADIEKVKAVSASQPIVQDDESDLLPDTHQLSEQAEEDTLLPGERLKRRSVGLRPTLN
jgi:uncharacterized membrane protein YkoI